MVEKSIVEALERKFEESEFNDCYVVEVDKPSGNKVVVYIDSDSVLTLKKCQIISRYLEKEIEKNKWLGERYTLEVSSPGIDRPLVLMRQYVKNIGRMIKVDTEEGDGIEGILKHATPEQIGVLVKIKKEEKLYSIPMNKIKRARIRVSFKKR